jgi:hypothetical protein
VSTGRQRRVGMWAGACRRGVIVLALCLAGAAAEAASIITAPDRAGIALDRSLLRSLFLLRMRTWPDGVPARIFVLADDDAMTEAFCREHLGTYPYVLRAAWDRAVFTGTGLAPTRVGSLEEMRRRVLATPGAIGYVDAVSGGLQR